MTCQSCKKSFQIFPEDLEFYEKLGVPAPTFCPECRMIRRMAIRNEHTLYSRTCDLCGENIISMYAPDSPFVVYCVDCWNSDKWDPEKYARDYDFSRTFFAQFREFMEKVPRISLYQHINEKSDYTNYSVYLKNSYLVFGGHHYEDCMYTTQSIYLKD
ncbi:hypothetical protein HY224_02980, partial [Candidatus Uhrbacteria bacterium]|nr:hypothetical protein [Candidatus Uhrbacteria bacterium]